MGKSIPALINPDVLSWARQDLMGFELDYIAHKTGIDATVLKQWEAGDSKPTISKLRKLAKAYNLSIAVFYLPVPPKIKPHPPRDRRFLPSTEFEGICPEFSVEFRFAEDHREIAIELLKNVGRPPRHLNIKATLRNSPEQLAEQVREFLGVSYDTQTGWRNPRIAFNYWRERIENFDILVFQSGDVDLRAMRGYSMYFDTLPIIGINRKDVYSARSFTLFHEMVHLILRTGSICDIEEYEGKLNENDKKIEIFCNSVAGSILVPKEYLIKEAKLRDATLKGDTGENAIKDLAERYSVSREVIVRRMLSLHLVDIQFYQEKREQYILEYKTRKIRKKGYPSPINDAISIVGKPFIGLVLDNLNREMITTSDFSEFVGLKIKHIEGLSEHFLLR